MRHVQDMISHMRLAVALSSCKFLENPTQGTVEAIKRIMAYYLVGTLKKRLTAVRNGATEWAMYSDSDHAALGYVEL